MWCVCACVFVRTKPAARRHTTIAAGRIYLLHCLPAQPVLVQCWDRLSRGGPPGCALALAHAARTCCSAPSVIARLSCGCAVTCGRELAARGKHAACPSALAPDPCAAAP